LTRLNYTEVTDIEYVTSSASLVLSPEQQSLAVQAVSIFRELYNWQDGGTEADDIDALVADTIAALTFITIPPKENMNNRILFFPYQATITAGNAFLFLTSGAWQQNAPTNGSSYNFQDIMLAKGDWVLNVHGVRQNSNGIIRIRIQDQSANIIDDASSDMYNATTGITTLQPNVFSITEDTLVDILVSAFGKNASSSNYSLPVFVYELVRV